MFKKEETREKYSIMGNYRNFKLTTYFVAQAAARITEEALESQLAFFEKYLRLDKVYL